MTEGYIRTILDRRATNYSLMLSSDIGMRIKPYLAIALLFNASSLILNYPVLFPIWNILNCTWPSVSEGIYLS